MTHPTMIEIPEEIETERLWLRAPRRTDAPVVCEAINESLDMLRPIVPWAREEMTLEAAEESICQAYAAFVSRTDLRIHIFLKETEHFVGGTGLHRMDWSVPRFEIGYWCRRSMQGKGYITEAASSVLELAFQQLAAQRVELRCDLKNIKSQHVAQRLGFHLEGCMRHLDRAPSGELRDTLLYSMIRADREKQL